MPAFLTRVVNRKVCIMRIIACVMMKCQSFQLLTYQEPLKHLIFNLKYNRRVLLLFKSCWPKAFYFSVCGFACKNAQKNCFQREVQITTFNVCYCHTMLCFIIILSYSPEGLEELVYPSVEILIICSHDFFAKIPYFYLVIAFTKIPICFSNERNFLVFFTLCVQKEDKSANT